MVVFPAVTLVQRSQRVVFACLAATIILVPLTIDLRGHDIFRTPKEIVFLAGAIAVLVALVFAMTAKQRLTLHFRSVPIALPLLLLLWTAVTTLTSSNRMLSADSLITVAAAVVLFIATVIAVPEGTSVPLGIVLLPALVNAIFITLQEQAIWQPFHFGPAFQGHLSSTALIGNPNDAGAYLLAPAIAALVIAVSTGFPRPWRIASAVIGFILLIGLVESGSRTAILAYGAALIAGLGRRSWKQATMVIAFLLVIAFAGVSTETSLGHTMRTFMAGVRHRQYNVIFSERLPPFLAAIEMVRDHPLMGVGPGGFKFHYLDYRLALTRKYPARWTQGWPMNFNEAHNDHLQTAAETGLPGYALMLTAIGALALPGFRKQTEGSDAARRFARELRLPLSVALFVIALAQFPLQLAAARLMFLYLAGICFAWDDES